MAPLAALLAFLLLAPVASAESLEGVVVRVVDGDTIHVRVGDRVEKVRYIGVNTPDLPRTPIPLGLRTPLRV